MMLQNVAELLINATAGVIGWVGHAVLWGTLLTLLTLLISVTLLRRAPIAVHGALWTVVLVKFLVPVGPSVPVSMANVAHAMLGDWTTPRMHSPQGLTETDGNSYVIFGSAVAPQAESPPTATTSNIWSLIGAVYLLGLTITLSLRIQAYRRFASQCRALPSAPDFAQEMAANVCQRVGLKRVPDLRINDAAPAPFVLGALRPMLILSPRQLSDPRELEAVLLHEAAHLRRGDLTIRYLQWLAGTVLYFWPVVAWVNRRIDLARETTCDDWALRHGRLTPPEYARCLLKALRPAHQSWSVHRPAAMASHLKTVERRIEMILNDPTRTQARTGIRLLAVTLIAGWSVVALGGAVTADEPAKDDVTIERINEDVLIQNAQPMEGGMVSEFMIVNDDAGPAGPGIWMSRRAMDSESLAKFMTTNPNADADGNGVLTMKERDGYLVALAMNDSAAVLTKYPHADTNKDGLLDAIEAAQLIQQPPMIHFEHTVDDAVALHRIIGIHHDAEVATDGSMPVGAGDAVIAQPADAIEHTFEIEIVEDNAGAPAPDGEINAKNVRIRTIAPVVGMLSTHEMVDNWLLDNIKNIPTRDQTAAGVDAVTEAPLAMFHRLHPEADTDKNGRVSEAERNEFMKRQMSRTHFKMLERFDKNGDGELTPDEMPRPHGGNAIFHHKVVDGDGNITIEIAPDGADVEEHVIIVGEPATPPSE